MTGPTSIDRIAGFDERVALLWAIAKDAAMPKRVRREAQRIIRRMLRSRGPCPDLSTIVRNKGASRRATV